MLAHLDRRVHELVVVARGEEPALRPSTSAPGEKGEQVEETPRPDPLPGGERGKERVGWESGEDANGSAPPRRRERGRDAPAGGGHHLELVRLPLAPLGVQEHRRAVEITVRPIEVAGADGELVREDAVAHRHLRGSAGGHPEAALVEALHRERTAGAVLGGEALQMTGVFADEVAARSPDGERQDEPSAGRSSVNATWKRCPWGSGMETR